MMLSKLKNNFNAQTKLKKVLTSLKLSIGLVGASNYAMGNPNFAVWCLIASGVIDAIMQVLD